jgi:hypothetical protein
MCCLSTSVVKAEPTGKFVTLYNTFYVRGVLFKDGYMLSLPIDGTHSVHYSN